MPCPSTGPKMFWACPNILSQTKNYFAFSATPKNFVLALKLNLQIQIIFWSCTKSLEWAKYLDKF